MLKTYAQISRFMDGPRAHTWKSFMYLKDRYGDERIGVASFADLSKNPILNLQDIDSGINFEYMGDYHNFDYTRSFIWFFDILEAGILYDCFDLGVQKKDIIMNDFHYFILNELSFEIARRQGAPLDQKTRDSIRRDLHFPAIVYSRSLEYLYACIILNKDVLLLRDAYAELGADIPHLIHYPHAIHNPNLSDSLDNFLKINPVLAEPLTDLTRGKQGINLNTPEEILMVLRENIPNEVLEAMYQQFLVEIDGQKRLEAIRAEYPREKLEEKVKSFAA